MDDDRPIDTAARWLILAFVLWLGWSKGLNPGFVCLPVIHSTVRKTNLKASNDLTQGKNSFTMYG